MTTLTKDVAYTAAKFYYGEGLNPIPITPGNKNPVVDWEIYQTQRVTTTEIEHWWNNGHQQTFNIGIVHGEVSGNYISIDLDHDTGILEAIGAIFPDLVSGRLEQSGSGQGYHIPLFVGELPDFGQDSKHNRPKGNKTWKCDLGIVNIRARYCQTVVPPSIHPSGNPYKFLQPRKITRVDNLDDFINWLNLIAPPKPKPKPPSSNQASSRPGQAKNLIEEVKSIWTTKKVLDHFGIVGKIQREGNNDIRILGHGGLIINEETDDWYCFSDEEGGGPIEAWAWQRFGNTEAKKNNFRMILLEMARDGGIDVCQYYRPGDENLVPGLDISGSDLVWESKYSGYWK